MLTRVLIFILTSSNALLSTASELQRCYLPETKTKIDVEKLSEMTWYTGLQTNDIAASIISCARLNNFATTESGFDVVLKERGLRFVEYDLRFTLGRNGIYYMDKSNKEINHLEHLRSMHGIYNQAVLDMAHQMIWGYFPSPNPTLSQIAAFVNVLHDVGISAKFHASTCDETNWNQE
uniref:uncharacterized protein LOC120341413 isoform X2 n=1 Tax=Styela clava TaxID=7725 RepID=UPI00193A8CB3|nr:uncharacterized protein LOC120341413 isoform X2 [Styela clava]